MNPQNKKNRNNPGILQGFCWNVTKNIYYIFLDFQKTWPHLCRGEGSQKITKDEERGEGSKVLILKLRNLWMATNSFKLLSIISRAVNLKYTFILWPIINYVFMYYEGRGGGCGDGDGIGSGRGIFWDGPMLKIGWFSCPRRNIIPTRTIIQGGWVSSSLLLLLLRILKNG